MSNLFNRLQSALSPPKASEASPAVEETEEEQYARMVRETTRQCEIALEHHLSGWLNSSSCPSKPIYEQWIAAVHPDNIKNQNGNGNASPTAIAIDPRLYLEEDMHRRLWNQRCEREVNPSERRRRHVPARANGSAAAGAVQVVSLEREVKGRASLNELSALQSRLRYLELQSGAEEQGSVGGGSTSGSAGGGGGGGSRKGSGDASPPPPPPSSSSSWPPGDSNHDALFQSYGPNREGKLDGGTAAAAMKATGVHDDVLFKIWELADYDQDGALDGEEFALALHLCGVVIAGGAVPAALPPNLVPPSQRPKKTEKTNPFGP